MNKLSWIDSERLSEFILSAQVRSCRVVRSSEENQLTVV